MTYKDVLAQHFPEGSYGGQCFTFLHRLCQFPPVGNFLNQKIASLNRFGIPLSKLDSFKVGDVVLQKYPVFGHGSLINAIVGTKLQFTESNFNLDGRVHHTRQIEHTDPSILGVFRGTLDYPLPVPVLNVLLVQQGAPWQSMGEKFQQIRQYVQTASKNQIDINIDTQLVNFPNIPFVSSPQYADNQKGVDQTWLNENIRPLAAGYHIVCFLVPESIAPPHGIVYGFGSEPVAPFATQVFADENETITAQTYGTMNLFVHTFLHENLGHCLALMQGTPDLTHNYLNDALLPSAIFEINELFQTYNWPTITNYLNND